MAQEVYEMDVALNLTMTEQSKTLVRSLIADVMEETNTVFPTEDKLRTFVRSEVRKALADEIKLMTRGMM